MFLGGRGVFEKHWGIKAIICKINHMYTSKCGYSSAPTYDFIMIIFSAGVAVVEEGGIALHEGNGELLEEVRDGDRLVLPSVSGKGAA